VTAQTALITGIETPGATRDRFCVSCARSAAAVLARIVLALTLIVVGGVLAPLLAEPLAGVVGSGALRPVGPNAWP
jgi:hypothetical protein